MYSTIQVALKARIDTILHAKYSPSFTTDPSGLSITLDTSQTSTSTTVYAKYTVASTQTADLGLIDLNTDGGVSNDVNFQLGYPDASNIVVTPSVWPAGQTTNITITGTNMGSSPSVYVTPFDITYSNQMLQADGSITATVTVPADTTDPSATVYVHPGYTGCTGSCRLADRVWHSHQRLCIEPNLPDMDYNREGAYPHVNKEFFQSVEMSSLGHDSCTRDLRAAPDVCDAGREASIPQD